MNVISFSLYGNKPMYLVGAIRNAQLVEHIYPGWRCRFYVGADVPANVQKELRGLGAEVVPGDPAVPGMLWRVVVNDDPEVARYCIRDVDSRLCERESSAVSKWMRYAFHTIQDHPNQVGPIEGGLWGGTPGHFNFKELLAQHPCGDRYGADRAWLAQHVWPIIASKTRVFDWTQRDWRPKLGDWRFVGEVFDEHDEPRPFDWQMRINQMTQ